jgi:hypothetical protein
MFVLAQLRDKIRVTPDLFRLSMDEAIKGELNKRFANRVIINVGLCITLYDILEIKESFIYQGDGSAHATGKSCSPSLSLSLSLLLPVNTFSFRLELMQIQMNQLDSSVSIRGLSSVCRRSDCRQTAQLQLGRRARLARIFRRHHDPSRIFAGTEAFVRNALHHESPSFNLIVFDSNWLVTKRSNCGCGSTRRKTANTICSWKEEKRYASK